MTGVCGAGVRDLAMLRIVLTRPIGEEDDPEEDPDNPDDSGDSGKVDEPCEGDKSVNLTETDKSAKPD